MSAIEFRSANAADDAGIRELLRESSTAGDIALSLRREPTYFAASEIGGRETTVVASEAGRIICVGSVSVRDRYVNGVVTPVGYLGQLRLAASHAGRADVLRRGYAFLQSIRSTLGAAVYFTSIAADNGRARRLLGRGARGLPAYAEVGDLVTVLISTSRFFPPRRQQALLQAIASSSKSVIDLLGAMNVDYQLSPKWTRAHLERMHAFGLSERPKVFYVGNRADATAALWNQRRFKQTVIAGYSSRLRMVRAVYNIAARLTFRVTLPPVGGEVAQAFVSHLAVRAGRPELLTSLIHGIGYEAKAAGIRVLTLSFDARDPRLPMLARVFQPRLYRTKLFTVTWPGEAASPLDDRLLYPEAALL